MKPFKSFVAEDLRKWFSKTDPEGGWKRINSKGEAIGPCAREPGEPKPKCMSNEKRAKLSKKERASAVAAKRKHDPNPERKGEPINVSNFGKGKISESAAAAIAAATAISKKKSGNYDKEGLRVKPYKNPDAPNAKSNEQRKKEMKEDTEQLDEKNVPTSPEKWAQAKAQAKAKFDVYPSAYANGWASKKYKEMGGGWKSVDEKVEVMSFKSFVAERCWAGHKPVPGKKPYSPGSCVKEEVELDEVAAWQRKEGKSEAGGLNRKGIESYRRENPGSKLSMAVTTKPSKLKAGSKAANRRKSFCARMSGMKKRLTSAKTAHDPDSRINKSLRKWNC